MEQHRKITPYFFFITLGVLVTLITTVSGFLTLVFETLNHVFPDVLTDSYGYGYNSYQFDGIRSSLAIVIIAFPLYLVLESRWYSAAKKTLTQYDEVLCRWALYLILFLTSLTVMIDLITLVRYFVGGEITTRFILKVIVTLITSGIVGWYYIRRLQFQTEKKWNVLTIVVTSSIVLASIVWAFMVIGGPGSQRMLKLDQKRLDDLQSIQYSVINYWQQTEMLPIELSALSTPLLNYSIPRDPEFQKGKIYEYTVVSEKTFELCATFTAPLPEGWTTNDNYGGVMMNDIAVSKPSSAPGFGGSMNESWQHGAGRSCFIRTIDPVFYPPHVK